MRTVIMMMLLCLQVTWWLTSWWWWQWWWRCCHCVCRWHDGQCPGRHRPAGDDDDDEDADRAVFTGDMMGSALEDIDQLVMMMMMVMMLLCLQVTWWAMHWKTSIGWCRCPQAVASRTWSRLFPTSTPWLTSLPSTMSSQTLHWKPWSTWKLVSKLLACGLIHRRVAEPQFCFFKYASQL